MKQFVRVNRLGPHRWCGTQRSPAVGTNGHYAFARNMKPVTLTLRPYEYFRYFVSETVAQLAKHMSEILLFTCGNGTVRKLLVSRMIKIF